MIFEPAFFDKKPVVALATGLSVTVGFNLLMATIFKVSPKKSIFISTGVGLTAACLSHFVFSSLETTRNIALKRLSDHESKELHFLKFDSLAPKIPHDELTEEAEAAAVRLMKREKDLSENGPISK